MDVTESSSFGPGAPASVAPPLDPRLQPTPDYGTLGPGSDIRTFGTASSQAPTPRPSPRFVQLIAIMIGMFGAIVAGTIGSAHSAWSDLFGGHQNRSATSKDLRQIDRMKPQKQAETLLELAVGHSAGAVDQISSHVDRWQGKVQWNSQIATLTTAALNSNDMRVRESGVEVELAAYGLAKNSASLEYLLKTADSGNHAQKIWALWALGLMGNRGVGADRVIQALTAHLKDADEDSRRWAVEGLALTGTTATIEPLLQTMHDDRSAIVRERAACGLAESGMFTQEQRMIAVPRLVNYTDDPALDAQTHAWASQALADITHQHFGTDSTAWRNWYNSTRTD